MRFAAAMFLLAPAADVAAEQPSSSLGYGLALIKMLVALAVVCALAYLILRHGVGRLFKATTAGRLIEVVDRCPLGGGKSLWIVQAEQRRFLLATAESTVNVVAELDVGGVGEVEPRAMAAVAAQAPPSGEVDAVEPGSGS